MPYCTHDGTKMLSNPFSTPDLFWCPKCGQHEYTSRNGKPPKLADVVGRLARVDSAEARNPGGIGRITAKDRGRFRVDSSEFPGQEVTGWWLIDDLVILSDDDAVRDDCTCVDLPDGRSLVCPTCRDRARAAAGGVIPF